jgi:peptidoglycan DL-endopeptidase LytE
MQRGGFSSIEGGKCLNKKSYLSVLATLTTFLTIMSPVAHAATTSSTTNKTYKVKPGDSLYQIARLFHISLRSLEDANPKIHHNLIYSGQTLSIPVKPMTNHVQTETHHPSATPRRSTTPVRSSETATQNRAQEILHTAYNLEGIHYDWGGTSPATGFDCSGFIQYIFTTHGISLPRTASEQAKVGRPVARSQLQPGDLMFFVDTYSHKTNAVTHVALYIGNGNVIESSSVRNQGVMVIHNILQNPWYHSRYYGARDVIGN